MIRRNDQGRSRQALEQLLAERVPFVTATVVRAAKPTSVRPGDAALVLRRRDDRRLRRRRLRAGVGAAARRARAGDRRGRAAAPAARAPATERDALDGVVVAHNPCLSGGTLEIFLDPQLAAPRDADRGRDADRPRAGGRRRAPPATRSRAAASRPAAVRRRARRRLARRRRGGRAGARAARPASATSRWSPARSAARPCSTSLDVDDALRAQVHTPAGLDIGARAPADIAISILAQMVAERTTHAPELAGRDRDRPGLRDAGRSSATRRRTSASAASACTSAATAAAPPTPRSTPSRSRRDRILRREVSPGGESMSRMLSRPLGLGLAALALVLASPAAAATTEFSSSFEAGDRALDWTSTAETDAQGNKKQSGVTGSAQTGIPGSVADKITAIAASAREPAERDQGEWRSTAASAASGWPSRARAGCGCSCREPIAVVHYALTSANDSPERDPKDWQLQGSQNGSDWTTLDTQSGQDFAGSLPDQGVPLHQHDRVPLLPPERHREPRRRPDPARGAAALQRRHDAATAIGHEGRHLQRPGQRPEHQAERRLQRPQGAAVLGRAHGRRPRLRATTSSTPSTSRSRATPSCPTRSSPS